jgi:putative ABC transport system permease protein
VAESTVLTVAGGLVGLVASLLLTFAHVSLMNQASWSEITFSFTPTPGILTGAVVAGVLMGMIGGFLPAIKAASTSPIEAMRG